MEQKTNHPAISVIVPVYKAEAFLRRCIESILAQSERSFELLLIDDGSPDGCPAICDEYAARDARVRVIHKRNAGVSAARNTGLDHASGDYVAFVDSDDYVDADYLSSMLCRTQGDAASDNAFILTDYQPFSPEGKEKREYPASMTVDFKKTPASAQAFRDLIFGFRLFPPYCKLFRRDVIEAAHLRFDTSLRTAEDFDFNMRYLEHVDEIRYIPKTSYHYRVAYKRYTPSNHGVLGDSEIRSAHIMAHGITDLAKRMGVYEEVAAEIERWAAKKHYFNRLPMLFAPSDDVSRGERKKLYKRLISDPVYRTAFKQGIRRMPRSTTKHIGCYADCFLIWQLFHAAIHKQKNKD